MKRIKQTGLLLGILLCSLPLSAGTYYVETTGDDANSGISTEQAFRTLNRAFLNLNDGDVLYIGEGVFTISRTLEWDGALSIIGAGADKTIIQAAEAPVIDKYAIYTGSVFYNQKPEGCDVSLPVSLIQGITIQNGTAPSEEPLPTSVGGGIKNFASLTVKDCVIRDNAAFIGGAVYNEGTLTLENSLVSNNHAFSLEGGVYNAPGASYTEVNVSFEANTQETSDFGIYVISDFESGFYGDNGTNGNYEGGLVYDSPMFQIVDNPDKTGLNPSDKVARFTRNRLGQWWAYVWFVFPDANLQTTPKYLHIMIRKPLISKVCVQVKDGYQPVNANTGEMISSAQTKVDEWEDLVYEISNTGIYSYIEIKPDFENAVTSERLASDIDIYFDNIIIDDSPEPRTVPEGKLGAYPLPIGTAGVTPVNELFQPSEVSEGVGLSDLSYTDILFDYNYSTGYFRPYGWPDGAYLDTRYLEFTVAPEAGKRTGITRIEITEKANTDLLGPQKILIAASVDSGKNFTPVGSVTLTRSAFNNDQFFINNLESTGSVIFRMYGYESLLGTSTQKDLWIIDHLEVYGTVSALSPASVSSVEITDITATSAAAKGNVTDPGEVVSTAHGFCWNTSGGPTLEDPFSDEGEVTASGEFSTSLTGLRPNTQYYTRAYTTGAAGTSYGEELTFSTALQELTLDGSFTVQDKEYDGGTAAVIAGNTLSLFGVLEGDDVGLASFLAEFEAAGAGSDITVIIKEADLSGTAAGNYTLSLEGAPVTTASITKKILNVTALDTSRYEGEANPDFKLKFEGFIENEGTEVIDVLPVAESSADENSPAGTYDIQVSGGSDNNYDFNYIAGTLTVEINTGISGPAGDGPAVYPNPTGSLLTVDLGGMEDFSLTLYDACGKKLFSGQYTGKTELNLSGEASGLYLLKIESGQDSDYYKIIKE